MGPGVRGSEPALAAAPVGVGDGAATWIGLSRETLPVQAVTEWARRPDCGAVAVFLGCVRDHSPGRAGVVSLEYEAYEGPAVARMAEVAAEARRRWPAVGRIAIIHRTGLLAVSEDAVVVAVSSPHRDEAFEAARFCIDRTKASVPIWKHETWEGGAGGGTCSHDLEGVGG